MLFIIIASLTFLVVKRETETKFKDNDKDHAEESNCIISVGPKNCFGIIL